MILIGTKSASQIAREHAEYTDGALNIQDAPLPICETYIIYDNKPVDTRKITESQLFDIITTTLESLPDDPSNFEDLRDLITEIRRQNGGEIEYAVSLINRLFKAPLGGLYNNLLIDIIDALDDSQTINCAKIIAQFEVDCRCEIPRTFSEEEVRSVIERMAENHAKAEEAKAMITKAIMEQQRNNEVASSSPHAVRSKN
ncbi:hypothetical protein IKF15_00940 [Candidatus Saccharibacteria bacterium]|nr:hypothetical protein [Candidatus Saccharibacteria bacterium]